MTQQEKNFPDIQVVKQDEAREWSPETGLTRKVLAYNDKLMLVEHHMEKGWVGSVHHHRHEQVVYVVHGLLKITCGEKTFETGTGDSFVVRGGIEHGAMAIEESLVIDVFTP